MSKEQCIEYTKENLPKLIIRALKYQLMEVRNILLGKISQDR